MASNKKSSTSAVYLTKLGRIKSWTVFFCIVGLVLSGYALFVEHQKEKDDSYTAMCDINEHVSCSKVFTSKYDSYLFKIKEPLLIASPLYSCPDMERDSVCSSYFLMSLLHSFNPIQCMELLSMSPFFF